MFVKKDKVDLHMQTWKDNVLGLEVTIIVKMMILLKAIYGFNTIPIKLLLTVFFTELKQKSQNFYEDTKDS